MITYNYKCPACKKVIEIRHKYDDETVYNCKECDIALKKVILPGTSIQFKGSGFYCTGG